MTDQEHYEEPQMLEGQFGPPPEMYKKLARATAAMGRITKSKTADTGSYKYSTPRSPTPSPP